jgi:hypothetical protein
MTIEDWNEDMNKPVADFINKVLLKFTLQIFNRKNDDFYPYGSGVLLESHGVYFLLTASHVVDYLDEPDNTLFVRVDEDKFINIVGKTNRTKIGQSNGVDLAYIKLADDMLQYLAKSYKFLTIDKISKHNPIIGGSNYCVLGFPEKNLIKVNGFSDSISSFYITSAALDNRYSYYNFDKKNFIIVNMEGKGNDMLNGGSYKIDSRFYGISGGGLWFLNFDSLDETNINSIDFRLIGIMTEFKKGKYYCLVANKIHLFLDAFREFESLNFTERLIK